MQKTLVLEEKEVEMLVDVCLLAERKFEHTKQVLPEIGSILDMKAFYALKDKVLGLRDQ